MGILKTLLKGLGYSVAFTLLTLFFTLVTFPEDRLREYVEVMAGQATGGRVNITELSLSGLGGVELTDAVLKMPPPETPEGASDRPGGMFQVQSMEVSASLLSMTSEPPLLSQTFRSRLAWIWPSRSKRSKMGKPSS